MSTAQSLFQVAVKRLLSSDGEAAAKLLFLKEAQTLQFVSAACQRVCRMLGCCNLDGDVCIVMSLYKSSAAALLQRGHAGAYKGLSSKAHYACSCCSRFVAIE